MERDKQIALLVAAASRTDRRVSDWMADEDVKAALRFYHQRSRDAKAPLKAACI